MSALTEEGLREIDELSKSSGDSFERSLEELAKVEAKGEVQEKIRSMAIDTEAHMLSLYKLALLKAKKADDADQIAKIWKGPLKVYEVGFTLVSNVIERGQRHPDFLHLCESLRKIRDHVRWIYELHGGK